MATSAVGGTTTAAGTGATITIEVVNVPSPVSAEQAGQIESKVVAFLRNALDPSQPKPEIKATFEKGTKVTVEV